MVSLCSERIVTKTALHPCHNIQWRLDKPRHFRHPWFWESGCRVGMEQMQGGWVRGPMAILTAALWLGMLEHACNPRT